MTRPIVDTPSSALAARALRAMPGGVSSPARSTGDVEDAPVFLDRGRGPWVFDHDGNGLIDYIGAWGAAIVGHAHPGVVDAVQQAATAGLGIGMTTPLEVQLAEQVIDRVPGVEQVRFACSGTEAVMAAIRLARSATGRRLVVRFQGGYHGHGDAVLSAPPGDGPGTRGAGSHPDTLVLPFNDSQRLSEALAAFGDAIACVLVEPIAGNMGLVPPRDDFIDVLGRVPRERGALLIADEVMTGFRVARGGALERLGLRADIVALAKILGGGLPVAAFAGPRSLMRHVAPAGPVFHAGTHAGNRVGMAAGLATLSLLTPEAYTALEARAAKLQFGIERALSRAGIRGCVQRVGSMLTPFLGVDRVENFRDASLVDRALFARFFRSLRAEGVLVPPSPLESWFVSTAHGDAEIRATVEAVERALARLDDVVKQRPAARQAGNRPSTER